MNSTYSQAGDFDDLAELETFNPDAFVGKSNEEQDVCNLILCFALIYNDIKDLFRAYGLNLNNEPENDKRTKYLGAYLGIRIHIVRLVIGITHEIVKKLEENRPVIESGIFQTIIKQLSKEAKESWQLLIDVANKMDNKDPRRKFLAKCRNKIAFHYDLEQIYRGYRYHFYGEDRSSLFWRPRRSGWI